MNFHLPDLPERTRKPRDSGLTMMMDKGLSLRQAEDFISVCADYTDLVKLGFGTSYLTNDLKRKIKLYRDAGINVYLGGTLFEAFIVRGKFYDYCRLMDETGIEFTEVSDGSISIQHDLKCEYISLLARNYRVLSEVGSKEAGILIHPNKWIKMMRTELNAGAWKVIAEARESGNVGIYRPSGKAHVALVNKILEKVPAEKILWEAPQKAQQVWFIKLLGANVNLGNIGYDEVIPLETLRLGIRGDTFFTFMPPGSQKVELANQNTDNKMKEVTVKELKKMQENGEDFQLIDVREDYEYDIANLDGEHIPMGEIMNNLDKISRDKKVVIHCRSGARSGNVVQALENREGFDNLYNLKGGILAWAKEIDTSLPTY